MRPPEIAATIRRKKTPMAPPGKSKNMRLAKAIAGASLSSGWGSALKERSRGVESVSSMGILLGRHPQRRRVRTRKAISGQGRANKEKSVQQPEQGVLVRIFGYVNGS